MNNQEIGRTGRDGRPFVPTLSSFNDNQVAIDVASVPIEYTFPESMRVISPAYRAGAVVNFHARSFARSSARCASATTRACSRRSTHRPR